MMSSVSHEYMPFLRVASQNDAKYQQVTYIGTPSKKSFMSIGSIRFKRAVPFTIYRDKDQWIHIENETAGFFSVGLDYPSAMKELEENIGYAWEDYVKCDPKELHKSGMALRKWLADNIEGPLE